MPPQTSNMQQRSMRAEASQIMSKFFFTYAATSPAVAAAAGSTGTVTFQIQADAAFLMQAWAALSRDTVTGLEVASPLTLVQITDTGSGTQFFSEAVPIRNVFGTAQLPFLLPTPRILQPNASVVINLTNILSTNPLIHHFAFHGQKLFED